MNGRGILSVLLIFTLLRGAQAEQPPVAAEPVDCRAQFSKMFTRLGRSKKSPRVEITQVTGVPIRSGTEFGDEVALEQIIGRKDALVVGMTSNHVYLFADGARLHGKMTFSGEGPRLIKPNTSMVKDGVIFVFPDAAPELVRKLRNRLRAKARRKASTLSCATATYRELRAVTGWTLPGCGLKLPATIVRQILQEGFRDAEGKPVKVDIYRTDDLEFYEIRENFEAIQKEGMRFVAVVGGLSVVLLGLVGNGLYEKYAYPPAHEHLSTPPRVYPGYSPKHLSKPDLPLAP